MPSLKRWKTKAVLRLHRDLIGHHIQIEATGAEKGRLSLHQLVIFLHPKVGVRFVIITLHVQRRHLRHEYLVQFPMRSKAQRLSMWRYVPFLVAEARIVVPDMLVDSSSTTPRTTCKKNSTAIIPYKQVTEKRACFVEKKPRPSHTSSPTSCLTNIC